MSALKSDEPPAMRARTDSAWVWPDRLEVTPPAVPAGRPVRSRSLPKGRWSIDMPDRAWPPLPEGMRAARGPEGDLLEPFAEEEPELDAVPFETVPAPRRPQADLDRPEAPVTPAVPGFIAQSRAAKGFVGGGDTPEGGFSFQLGANAAAVMDWPVEDEAPRRHDPSPSRLAYRLNRMWLTPGIRRFVRFGLPLLLVLSFAAGWMSKPENRAMLEASINGVIDHVQNQPMFRVNSAEVISASPEVAEGVESLLNLHFPVSSWDLDLAELRATAESLDAVEGAWLQIRSGGVLEIRLTERVPAMVWRAPEGLYLVDDEGHRVARLATRAARADLPLIAGEGATAAVAEAQTLWAAAAPIQSRMRGLVRVSERRWDVVLDRDQRILLPAEGALEALERVVAMSEGVQQQLLSRDVQIVDMRNPARPTLRLTAAAMQDLTRNRNQSTGASSR
ncbi:cell division protein FtsQ/DivIB [Pararhodobacter sp. CCB-MM2]|uniref:cell division protein FtsQ/DivIB n=1 Tax=Pararhodobacter sp. CCB-MM2 TaxID=1786003 RepID=UPI000A5819B6|nr:cell division protein FtsQ/DivIB [Pararhodobacter sp. CCB-MM2]